MQETAVKQQNPGNSVVNAIGAFFISVVKSCYDMEFYRKVRSRPWPHALKYAALFHAALAMFATAMLGSYLFGAETAFIAHVSRTFPNDARLEVKSGHLSTNLPEPFEAGSKWIRVIIDTSVVGFDVPERYEGVDGVLVGKDAIFMPKPNFTNKSFVTQRRVYRMEEFSEFTVTKAELLEWMRAWGGLFILGGLVCFAVMYWLFMLVVSVLYAMIASLIAMVLGVLLEVRLSYEAWFAVGLHAVTLPLLVSLAASAMDVRIPFAYTFIFLMFIGAVLIDERNQPVSAGPGKQQLPPPPRMPASPPEPPAPPPPRSTRRIAKKPSRPKKKPSEEKREE
ncbi:MAG TPA: DUF1189 family protein [Candidatus Eisenbacteria bacterium]|nr:DUF1189 family protein [Candidatus Eisenbacteria bacterium]